MIKATGTATVLFPPAAIAATSSGTYLVDRSASTGKFTVIANAGVLTGTGAIDIVINTYDTSGGTETAVKTVGRIVSGTPLVSAVIDSRDCGKYLVAVPTVSGTVSGNGLSVVALWPVVSG